jgi:hypothetical protein
VKPAPRKCAKGDDGDKTTTSCKSSLAISTSKSTSPSSPSPLATATTASHEQTLFVASKEERKVGFNYVNQLWNAAVREKLLAAFVAQHHHDASYGSFGNGLRSWLSVMYSLPSRTRALETATHAVMLAKMGQDINDPSVTRESLKIYTHALQRLQLALWDPRLMYSDETLGACMMLAMYELIQCPSDSRTGYISHHRGISRLVQLRGPKAHSDGFGHSVFLVYRLMGVSVAFSPTLCYQPVFLTPDRQWRVSSSRRHFFPNQNG